MKNLLILVPLILFVGSSHIVEATSADSTGLVAAIENAKYDEKNSSISLEFVLRNSSSEEIRIAERWNSWGAYQWKVLVTRVDNTVMVFGNPQIQWKRNFLTTLSIQPGGEYRMFCRLFLKGSVIFKPEMEVFVAEGEEKEIGLPLKLIGTFSADALKVQLKEHTNWVGAIQTPEVKLGDFSEYALLRQKFLVFGVSVTIVVIGFLCFRMWAGSRAKTSSMSQAPKPKNQL